MGHNKQTFEDEQFSRDAEGRPAFPPPPADRHCITCGAVLLKLCECPHCGTPIQAQPK